VGYFAIGVVDEHDLIVWRGCLNFGGNFFGGGSNLLNKLLESIPETLGDVVKQSLLCFNDAGLVPVLSGESILFKHSN